MKKYRIDEITDNLDNLRKPLNSIERSKISKNKLYPYYGANNLMDYVDEYIFDEEILCVAEDGGSWGYREKCSYIVNEKCWVNNHAHVLRAKDNLNIAYLSYYLNYSDLSSSITGTTRGKLTKSALNSIEILLPELEVQNKIVKILDKAQDLIYKRKEQIATLDELVKSKFIEMFGDPILNPKNWEKSMLQECCFKITDGTHDTPKRLSNGKLLITGKNIRRDKIDLTDIEYVSEEDHQMIYKRCNPEYGDVLYTNIGANYGTAVINSLNYEFSMKNVALLKPNNDKIIGIYLWHYLNLCRPYILEQNKAGGAQTFMSLATIKKLNIFVPSLELQNQFADFVKQVDKLKFEMEKSLKELEDNFNSLMQKAFKGELFN